MTLHLPMAYCHYHSSHRVCSVLSQRALAVFNDGVRPSSWIFTGETERAQMTAIASAYQRLSLAWGANSFSSGILIRGWLFLPSDILGILSPKRGCALI